MKFKFKLEILKRIEEIRHKQKLFELASKIGEAREYEKKELHFKVTALETYKTTNQFKNTLGSDLVSASSYREFAKDKAFANKARKNNALAEADDIRSEIFQLRSKIKTLKEKEVDEKRTFMKNMEKKIMNSMPSIKKTIEIFVLITFLTVAQDTYAEENYTDKAKKLTLQEQSLVEKEKKLKEWEEDLQKREQALQDLMGKIDQKVQQKKTVDMKLVKDQTKMISKMKPVNAANLLSGMNEELALEVLKQLKPSQISQIFNNMNNTDVVRLTEIISGYRLPNSGGMELRKKAQ